MEGFNETHMRKVEIKIALFNKVMHELEMQEVEKTIEISVMILWFLNRVFKFYIKMYYRIQLLI